MGDKIDIVVARYNENVNWIDCVCENRYNIFVYNKGSDSIPQEYMKIKNVGREAQTYLQYIITNYNNLPRAVIFLQGDPFAHSYNIELLLNTPIYGDNVGIVHNPKLGRNTKNHENFIKFLNTHEFGDEIFGFGHYHGDVGHMIEREHISKMISTSQNSLPFQSSYNQGAQYYVPKKYITSKPLTFWSTLMSLGAQENFNGVDTHSFFAETLERMWLEIFKYETI